jgi:FkbM family methyltransferase
MTQYYGSSEEDKFIEEYFPEGYVGRCIEVGGSDGITHSNTYYFEKTLGWQCLVIEPQPGPRFFDSCKEKRETALQCAVASENKDDVEFTVVFCNYQNNGHQAWGGISGLQIDQKLVEAHKEMGLDPREVKIPVPTRRLDWIMEEVFGEKYPTVDFITIDTEGTELDVLKSFDTTKYGTKLIIVENNWKDPAIGEYLAQYGWRRDKVIEQNEFFVRKV